MRFSHDRLTPAGSRVLAFARRARTGLLSAAALLAANHAYAADVTVITADKALETTPRVGLGDGLCGHFVQAAGGGTVNNAALATAILTAAPGAPAQKPPAGLNNGDSSFYGIAYLIDYYDDTAGTNGSFGFDALFPWSRSSGGQICVSQQGDHAPQQGDAFAAGFTGLLNVQTAGTKTFAIGSDDGYRLRIGGVTVAA